VLLLRELREVTGAIDNCSRPCHVKSSVPPVLATLLAVFGVLHWAQACAPPHGSVPSVGIRLHSRCTDLGVCKHRARKAVLPCCSTTTCTTTGEGERERVDATGPRANSTAAPTATGGPRAFAMAGGGPTVDTALWTRHGETTSLGEQGRPTCNEVLFVMRTTPARICAGQDLKRLARRALASVERGRAEDAAEEAPNASADDTRSDTDLATGVI